jgi:hypothetical protein
MSFCYWIEFCFRCQFVSYYYSTEFCFRCQFLSYYYSTEFFFQCQFMSYYYSSVFCFRCQFLSYYYSTEFCFQCQYVPYYYPTEFCFRCQFVSYYYSTVFCFRCQFVSIVTRRKFVSPAVKDNLYYVLLDVVPYSLVGDCKLIDGTYCISLQGLEHDGVLKGDCMISLSKRPQCELVPLVSSNRITIFVLRH